MKKNLITVLFLCGASFAQLWTGILDPKRAINWTTAGATIPSRTTLCSVLSTGATLAQINNALAACTPGQAVFLGAGTYNLAGSISIPNNVTLRGAGADKTFLVYSAGGSGPIYIVNADTNFSGAPHNIATWTAGYAAGSTSITLGAVSLGTINNLHVGSLLILDQQDDSSDTGNIFVTQDTGTSSSHTQGGGSGAGRPGTSPCNTPATCRSQMQQVTVTSISGTGPWTVGISPGIYAQNWRSGQNPNAWWSNALPITGVGIEDLSIDVHSAAPTGQGGIIYFQNATNSWVKGIRSINTVGAGCWKNHVRVYQSTHITVRDSYFYGSCGASDSYAVDFGYGAADNLAENNIGQQIATSWIREGDAGSVFGYNFAINDFYTPSGGLWQQQSDYHHGPDYLGLREGNQGVGLNLDNIHNSGFMDTSFRNYWPASESGKTQNTEAVNINAYNRYPNLVGNILGTTGKHTIYSTNAASATDAGNAGNGEVSIYTLGYSGNEGTRWTSGFTINNDLSVATTLMRWGNCDAVSGFALCRFVAGEVPSGISPYQNPVPANNTLPNSFYLSAKPSWFGSLTFPSVGPDVSTGNVSGTGGRVFKNPARVCYESMGGPADGSGAALSFNAGTCYAPGSFPVVSLSPTSINFPLQLVGTQSAPSTVTLTNTGTDTLVISSFRTFTEFVKTSSTCGDTLNAGASCTTGVAFAPTGGGIRTGILQLTDNASGSPHIVSLSGPGLVPGIVIQGNVEMTGNFSMSVASGSPPTMGIVPSSLNFGATPVGSVNTLILTVTNTGSGALLFSSIVLADISNYSEADNCTSLLAAQACTINVTFSPTSVATLNTTLTIVANDSGSPHAVTILGTGIAVGGDLPFPNFVLQGGVAFSLPQAGVDPMVYSTQSVAQSVYIGNSTCPTAPARTNYLGVAKGATVCDFADSNGAGLQSSMNDWCSYTYGGDQRWDVVVTKGTSFNFAGSLWTWCDKYNGTPASKYIVFHSDTPNPRGRTVCSHGIQDVLTPPLPDGGQRNHGCQGLLGMPAVTVPMPVTSGAYTNDSSYNDLANMWTITANGPVVKMGAASTLGDPFNDCGIPSGAGACPTDGVNHIVIQDARILPTASTSATSIPVQVKAAEWFGNGALIAHFLPAAPHDIGFDEDYFTADADDDGFGNNKITDALQMACATCWANHNYFDGIKRDGSEDHVINTANAPGPVQLNHNWCEGGAVCFWNGQAELPLVVGLLNNNLERRRNRLTYNPRWLPSPAGLQSFSKTVSGGSCSGGTLTLNFTNTGANIISSLIVYPRAITGVTVTGQWYTASSVTSGTSGSAIIPSSGCSGTTVTGGKIFGFSSVVNVTSAAAMNGKAVTDPTNNNPVAKNRSEMKSGVKTIADGEICENSGADGQDGSCYVISSRNFSGASWAPPGGQDKQISDFALTNSIVRHSNNAISIGSRSGSNIVAQFAGVTNITCAASGNSAAITATGLNAGTGIADPPNTQTTVGTDIYLASIGNGVISGTPLLANGFYATAYPTGGSYHNDAVVTVIGTAICPASDTTSSGTVYAPTGSNGSGVNTPGHRYIFQNLLIYDIGDHTAWNGGGAVSIGQIGSGLNNWSVNMTVTQVSPVTIVNAAVTAIGVTPISHASPAVVQATVGDLAYVQCLNDSRFSSGLPKSKGAPMLTVAGDQLSFTYTPQNGTPALTLSDTTTCELQTPNSNTESGYYGYQSFPWPFFWNHITGVGVNSFWLSPGGAGSYIKIATYSDSFQLKPGTGDIAPANTVTTGGVHCVTENYSASDTSGITWCNDRTGLTMQRYVLSTRSINNFPNFLAGTICGSVPCSQDPAINPGTNSVPPRVSTSGASVTCGGVPCDSSHFLPDSVGLAGSMGTNNYPLNLPDFRSYALDSSSPYRAAGILHATDGKDVGVQMSILLNAQNRTLYPCPLPCGTGLFRDGPQYSFLRWSASSDPGLINYRVYRDGAGSPTATVTSTFYTDYDLSAGSHTWIVKAWNGSIETTVSGLTSVIY